MLIKERIKAQIHHFGKDERILFENKDFTKELESVNTSINNPTGNFMTPEDILSVSEQTRNIYDYKNIDPAEKMSRLVSGEFNPFVKPNFNFE
jgi:hypothetical protein